MEYAERDEAEERPRPAPAVVPQRLEVGAADDRAEHEADRLADLVVRGLGSTSSIGTPHETRIRRRERPSAPEARGGSVGAAPGTRVRRQPAAPVGDQGGPVDESTSSRIAAARGRGEPMDDGLRTSMEDGFGADFSGVRFHHGTDSDALNHEFGARAFTVGSDVFFRGGRPDTSSTDGRRLVAHELAHTLQQGAAGGSRIRRNGATDQLQREIDALRQEWTTIRRPVLAKARTAGLLKSTEASFDGDRPEVAESGVGRLAWDALSASDAAVDEGARNTLPGMSLGSARDSYMTANFHLRRASTLVSALLASGREMVAARAGTKSTAEELQGLVSADADQRAAEIFTIFKDGGGNNQKTFNRIAQWLSDGKGGQVDAAYYRMHRVLSEAYPDVTVKPNLWNQVSEVFGSDSARTLYLVELGEHGRAGGRGKLLAALGVLGPRLSFTFGYGLGETDAVIRVARQSTAADLNFVIRHQRSAIKSIDSDLLPRLEAMRDKRAIDETARALKSAGVDRAQVISPAGDLDLERRNLSTILELHGKDREKLIPAIQAWANETDPQTVAGLLRDTLEQFYGAASSDEPRSYRGRRGEIDFIDDIDTGMLIDFIVMSTGVIDTARTDTSPDTPVSGTPSDPAVMSRRRGNQIEALIDDHVMRIEEHGRQSRGAPTGYATQLLTTPTINPSRLIAMIEGVIQDGESVRGLIAKHGGADAARHVLEDKLARSYLSKGQQVALLDKMFFGNTAAGDGYVTFVGHIFDGGPKKGKPPSTKEKRTFTRELVAAVAPLTPAERQLVKGNRSIIQQMALRAGADTTGGGDLTDPENWRIVMGALGISDPELAAALRPGSTKTSEVASDRGLGASGAERFVGYQEAAEQAVGGAEMATTEYWSARIISRLSKEFGIDKGDKDSVAAIALLQEAQANFPADERADRTKQIGDDIARVSKSWAKRIRAANDNGTQATSAKQRLAAIFSTGRLVTDADVMAVAMTQTHKASGSVSALQTNKAKLEQTLLSIPAAMLLADLTNFGEVEKSMRKGQFPRLLLDLSPELIDYLKFDLPRAKRLTVMRSLRDRIAEAAAADGSIVHELFEDHDLSPEQAKLFAIQTKVLGDLDQERLLLSGVQWERFNNLSQMRRQARNEELGALRGARQDVIEVPGALTPDALTQKTKEIGELSGDLRSEQARFTAMRETYKMRVVLLISTLMSIAFSALSLGLGLPAASALIQIVATAAYIVISTAALEFTKWALMGDSQDLGETFLNILFSLPTAVVAGFVAGPLQFSADFGLRILLEDLGQGAPFVEMALRSYLVANVGRIANAPVAGLQSWLTSEQDPDGVLSRFASEAKAEGINQVKMLGMSFLKGVAKAAVPEGVRETDVAGAPSDSDSREATDREFLKPWGVGGSDVDAHWGMGTYAMSPTEDMIGWNAAGRQVLADLRNLGIEQLVDFATKERQASNIEMVTPTTEPEAADVPVLAGRLINHLQNRYVQLYLEGRGAAVPFHPDAEIEAYYAAHGIRQHYSADACDRVKAEFVRRWNAMEADTYALLQRLPANMVDVDGWGPR